MIIGNTIFINLRNLLQKKTLLETLEHEGTDIPERSLTVGMPLYTIKDALESGELTNYWRNDF